MSIFRQKYLLLLLILIVNFYQIIAGIPCPRDCHCSLHGISIGVDCSGLGIYDLPELPDDIQIDWLDLSDNQFTAIPPGLAQLTTLETLDLSGNKIQRLQSNALNGFTNLKTLKLSKNNITNWSDINPNTLLQPTVSLLSLSLSGNPLTSFSSTDERLILTSSSLKTLELNDCKISKVTGQHMLQGLPKLEHLNLSGNPTRSISTMMSNSLISINLSNCRLSNLQPDIFSLLSTLTYVNLSRNHRLSLMLKTGEVVTSDSLKRIDLSYCNMDAIELSGFSELLTVILRGNMIRQLTKDSFTNNKLLENIDLSFNAISHVNTNAFRDLIHLKHLDLSYNMIPRIERDTFKENELLTSINLSRNYIGRFNRIIGKSLSSLNMSWCEILTIDPDALVGMPDLNELDLSNNLISDIPDSLGSESLQSIDLSMCRISSIRNTTFHNFPELSRIKLTGNRFTTPFRYEFFLENPFLQEIWLGDNPWRCDCNSEGFLNFFLFLTEPPAKIWDKSQLRCFTPDEVYGRSWEHACYPVWFPDSRQMGTAEKVWTFLMISIIVFCGSICVIMSVKKCIQGRKLTQNERERESFLEEQRDIMRQNRMRMEQEAQLNAPDPRESRPPCYEDALLMPRLDGSFASLNDLTSRRDKRRKLEEKDEDDVDGQILTRRNRCRSEEVLSMRESRVDNTSNNRRSRRARNQNNTELSEIPRTTILIESEIYQQVPAPDANNRSHIADSDDQLEEIPLPKPPPPPPPPTSFGNDDNELFYHSTDILQLNRDLNSPESPLANLERNSLRLSTEFEEVFKSKDHSPYAKRKSTHMASFKGSNPIKLKLNENDDCTEIMVVDDYFSPPKGSRSSEDEIESFSTFSKDEMEQLSKSSPKRDEIKRRFSNPVMVHRPPTESDL